MRQEHHILVVDNDHAVREILHTLLTESGYRVSSSPQGPQARRALADGLHLLVADIAYESMHGTELALYAEELGIPAVLMTSDMGQAEALENAGHTVIVKPFRLQLLQAIVRQVLISRVPALLAMAVAVLCAQGDFVHEVGTAFAS